MKKVNRSRFFVFALLLLLMLYGCSGSENTMADGYYTAEMAEFDEYGWKEFITIYVKDDKIVSVDYEAKNESGFIKSWDMDYMRTMNGLYNTYPNQYVRAYSQALLSYQDPEKVQAITGATHSFDTFKILAAAAIAQAKTGAGEIAYVDMNIE